MKKTIAAILVLSILGLLPLLAQQDPANPRPEEKPVLRATAPVAYNAEGRRDPFKDLLAGAGEGKAPVGDAQGNIEDLILIGIIKAKKGYTAVVGTAQGFPRFMTVGDRVADGYIESINANQVVFRKTHERGVPLMRPRDVIKEINPEER
jgi:Tfp pilus assembly protein PilP